MDSHLQFVFIGWIFNLVVVKAYPLLVLLLFILLQGSIGIRKIKLYNSTISGLWNLAVVYDQLSNFVFVLQDRIFYLIPMRKKRLLHWIKTIATVRDLLKKNSKPVSTIGLIKTAFSSLITVEDVSVIRSRRVGVSDCNNDETAFDWNSFVQTNVCGRWAPPIAYLSSNCWKQRPKSTAIVAAPLW